MSKIIKFYRDARKRTQRKQSTWNWLLLPSCILGFIISAFVVYKGLFAFREYIYPKDIICVVPANVGGVLMMVLPGLLVIPLGFMLGNLLVWCIPPARKALNLEVQGAKGAGYRENQLFFLKLAGVIFLVIAPFVLGGTFNYAYFTPKRIVVRPLFSFKEYSYSWSDIARIESEFDARGDSPSRIYVLHMNDHYCPDIS